MLEFRKQKKKLLPVPQSRPFGVKRISVEILQNQSVDQGKFRSYQSKISVSEVIKGIRSLSQVHHCMQKDLLDFQCVWPNINTRKEAHLAKAYVSCNLLFRCLGGDFNINILIQERFPIERQTKGMRKCNKFIVTPICTKFCYLMRNSHGLEKAA